MENIRIGIIAEDRDYAMALASGITQIRRDIIVDILTSRDKAAVCAPAAEEKRTCGPVNAACTEQDLLLVEEKFAEDAEKVIVLCRERQDQCMDCEKGIWKLWRYSNIRDIVSNIIYIYTMVYDRHIPYVEKGNVRFYGFFSHAGGTGCTSLAMGAAQELKRFHGRSVIYVSMEQISSSSEYMKNVSGERTIAEYLYHCLGRKRDLWHVKDIPCESFLARNEWGVESLAGSPGRNPLPYLEREDIPAFFSSIVRSGRYDTVVMDAGCSLAAPVTDALDMCDSLCFVRDPERIGKKAEFHLEHILSVTGSGKEDHMVIADNRRNMQKEDERSRILDELFSDEEEDEANVRRQDQSFRGAGERERAAGSLQEGHAAGWLGKTADVIIEKDPHCFRKEGGMRKILSDCETSIRIRELTEKLIAAAGDS